MAIFVFKKTLATINPSFSSIDELGDSTTFLLVVSQDLRSVSSGHQRMSGTGLV